MPLCTTCTRYIPYLYTVYESAFNLRLEQCTCGAFADPYVEHDSLLLLIDLILLKRGVYRHLLFNRGAEPRRIADDDKGRRPERPSRWPAVLPLGGALTAVDAFIRWSYLHSAAPTPWSQESIIDFCRTVIGCFAETLAFHSGVMLACYAVLSVFKASRFQETDIRKEFRFSLIPLTLFYSSFTKLFLLFLLTVWRPSTSPIPSLTTFPWYMHLLDDDVLDREWIVRNVLGGMTAGFGLRVVLDCPPILTMIIILVGWATKTLTASVYSMRGQEKLNTRQASFESSDPLVNRLRKNVFFSDIYGDCHKLKIMGFDPPELDMLGSRAVYYEGRTILCPRANNFAHVRAYYCPKGSSWLKIIG